MGYESAPNDSRELTAPTIGAPPRRVRLNGTGWLYALSGLFFFGLGVAGAVDFILRPSTINTSASSKLWFFALAAGVSLFGLGLMRGLPLQRRLAIEGVVAQGCVTEREWKGPSRGPSIVDYTFRNAQDEVEIGSCPSDPRKPGSIVCVLYLPSNPSRSAIYPLEFFRIDQ